MTRIGANDDPIADLLGEEPTSVLPRTSVADQAVTAIKDMIATGELQPGDKLPAERRLAELLQISRPTLRQALGALSAMNIIESRHGGGTYVTALTPGLLAAPLSFLLHIDRGSAQSLFEVRRALEVTAASLVAGRITDVRIDQLRRVLQLAADSITNREVFVAANIRFHDLIIDCLDNDLYTALYRNIARLSASSRQVTARSRRVRERAHRDHEAIVDALSSRDADSAALAMLAHLEAMMTASPAACSKPSDHGEGGTRRDRPAATG